MRPPDSIRPRLFQLSATTSCSQSGTRSNHSISHRAQWFWTKTEARLPPRGSLAPLLAVLAQWTPPILRLYCASLRKRPHFPTVLCLMFRKEKLTPWKLLAHHLHLCQRHAENKEDKFKAFAYLSRRSSRSSYAEEAPDRLRPAERLKA